MKTGGIIVEGAEQVGKSTFCNKLREMLNLDLVHMHKDYGFIGGKFDYVDSYFHDISKRNRPLIFDRHYVSELAYGRLFGRNNIDPEAQNKIEERLRDLGYIVVLLIPPGNSWIERDEMISNEQNKKVIEHYEDVYKELRVTKMRVNAWDVMSPQRVIELYGSMP